MDARPFTRATLRMFAGVFVWAVHFGAIYGYTALSCAFAPRVSVTPAIVAITVIALGATALFVVSAVRAGAASFENWMTAAVGALAALAIAWEGLVPVFIVPACGDA